VADKELESDDPMEFVAMRFPAEPGVDPDERMARCFVEEYALLGFPPDKVFRLFESQLFTGTHAVLERRGPGFVTAIIDNVYGATAGEEATSGRGL
jgi:hypothetical protein